jgi:hypothetical protein
MPQPTQRIRQVLSGTGKPLDAGVRNFFESRFKQDFSRVRVHADEQAGESARDVGARAYTAGSHVVFGPGQYRPGSEQGRAVLAHELAHVVQQENVSVSMPGQLGDPKDSAEGEADRVASQVMQGASANPSARDDAGVIRRLPFPGVIWDPKVVFQAAAGVMDPFTQALAQIKGIDADIHKYLSATTLNGGPKAIRTVNAVDNSTTPPTNIQFVFNLEVKHDSSLAKNEDALFDGGVPVLGGTGANRTFTASMTMKINPAATSVSLAQKLYHEGIHMILFMEDLLPGSPPSPHAAAFANYKNIFSVHKNAAPLATEIEAFVKAGQKNTALPAKAATEIPAHLVEEKYVFDQEKAKFNAVFTNRQLAFTYLLEGFTNFGVTAQPTDKAVVSMGDKATAIFDEIDKQITPKAPATPAPKTTPKKNP